MLVLWDAIFANIPSESLAMLADPEYNPLSQASLAKIESDPMNFLEFLAVAMVQSLKKECNTLLYLSLIYTNKPINSNTGR